MAFNIAFIIQAINKFSGPAKEIADSTKMIMYRFKRMGEAGLALQHKMQGLFLKMALPIGGLGIAVLHTAATFQTLRMSFSVLMGDQKKSTWLFNQMIDLSQKFGAGTTQEFAQAARSLLAVGAQAKNIPPVLSHIADIAAVSGIPIESMAMNVAKVFAGGVVRRQFIRGLMRSTDILQEMANVAGKTKSQISIMMSKGKLGAAIFLKAITLMTSKGHLFYKGQERAMHTLRGSYFLVKDAIQLLVAKMGMFLNKNFLIVDNMIKLKNIIIDVKNNFDFYMTIYGPMVRTIMSAIGAFLTLIIVTYALGTAMRIGAVWVSVFTGALFLAKIAGLGVVRIWKTLKWIWRAMNTEIAITDILLSPILIVLGLVAIAVGLLIYVFIRWNKQIGTLIETKLKPLILIWKKLGHFIMWLVGLFKKHFPIIARVIGKEVDWIIKKFDALIDKIKHFFSFFKKIGHGFKVWHHWVEHGTPTPGLHGGLARALKTAPKMLPSGVMAHAAALPLTNASLTMMKVPLSTSLNVADLGDAFANALETSGITEGLTTHINIGVSGETGLKIDKITHMSSHPNVEVGTIMPLAAGGY